MKHMLLWVGALALALMTGCSSNPSSDELSTAELKQLELQTAALKTATLSIECGDTGCPGLKVSYKDPKSVPTYRAPTNVYDAWNHTVSAAVGVAPVIGITKVAVDLGKAAVSKAGGNTSISGSYNQSSESSSTSSSVADSYNQSESNVSESYNPSDTTTTHPYTTFPQP